MSNITDKILHALKCADCLKTFKNLPEITNHIKQGCKKNTSKPKSDTHWRDEKGNIVDDQCKPDWSGKCENCGQSPIVPTTGLCGPCTFGEAETVGGNW